MARRTTEAPKYLFNGSPSMNGSITSTAIVAIMLSAGSKIVGY